eukprot:4965019-Pleurochrysis_carterae.AAC.3
MLLVGVLLTSIYTLIQSQSIKEKCGPKEPIESSRATAREASGTRLRREDSTHSQHHAQIKQIPARRTMRSRMLVHELWRCLRKLIRPAGESQTQH